MYFSRQFWGIAKLRDHASVFFFLMAVWRRANNGKANKALTVCEERKGWGSEICSAAVGQSCPYVVPWAGSGFLLDSNQFSYFSLDGVQWQVESTVGADLVSFVGKVHSDLDHLCYPALSLLDCFLLNSFLLYPFLLLLYSFNVSVPLSFSLTCFSLSLSPCFLPSPFLACARHKVVMITGDNPLTACYVAKELGIAPGKRLILSPPPPLSASSPTTDSMANIWSWQSVNATTSVAFSSVREEICQLGNDYNLCLTGEVKEFSAAMNYFL